MISAAHLGSPCRLSPPLPLSGEASGEHAGVKIEISFQDPSEQPPQPPLLLASFNAREMVSQGTDAFQVKLDYVNMRGVRDHPVFAANIKRSKSQHHAKQAGIFPGSYMAFAKRGSAWELAENHAEFVRLGFSIKVVGEVAAK